MRVHEFFREVGSLGWWMMSLALIVWMRLYVPCLTRRSELTLSLISLVLFIAGPFVSCQWCWFWLVLPFVPYLWHSASRDFALEFRRYIISRNYHTPVPKMILVSRWRDPKKLRLKSKLIGTSPYAACPVSVPFAVSMSFRLGGEGKQDGDCPWTCILAKPWTNFCLDPGPKFPVRGASLPYECMSCEDAWRSQSRSDPLVPA